MGQRVGIGWTAKSCQHCDACINGEQVNCEQGTIPTILNNGGFAEKLRARPNDVSIAMKPNIVALEH